METNNLTQGGTIYFHYQYLIETYPWRQRVMRLSWKIERRAPHYSRWRRTYSTAVYCLLPAACATRKQVIRRANCHRPTAYIYTQCCSHCNIASFSYTAGQVFYLHSFYPLPLVSLGNELSSLVLSTCLHNHKCSLCVQI